MPISELFDMAASPVRKLLNPYFENGEISSDLETTTSSLDPKKTPLSTQDLMVLNERSMLVAKYHDESQIDKNNLLIITAETIPAEPTTQ